MTHQVCPKGNVKIIQMKKMRKSFPRLYREVKQYGIFVALLVHTVMS